jgi:hypothetical protein
MKDPLPIASRRAVARSAAEGAFKTWETRTQLVKSEMAAASAANDAKTVRLRALRLEKERQEAEAGLRDGVAPAPVKAKKKAIRRFVAG